VTRARFVVSPNDGRPPYLPARERSIGPEAQHRLRSWALSALGLAADTAVTIREWVAMDPRAIPHVVTLVFPMQSTPYLLVVHKAHERIAEEDVRVQAAEAQALAATARVVAVARPLRQVRR
jgi:hypothetical protein